MFYNKTKHIDVEFHFIRDIIKNGDIKLVKILTIVSPTDADTVVIPLNKF